MKKRIRLSEAARIVGVHTQTLRLWAKNGRVGCVILPNKRMEFTMEQLDDLISQFVETTRK